MARKKETAEAVRARVAAHRARVANQGMVPFTTWVRPEQVVDLTIFCETLAGDVDLRPGTLRHMKTQRWVRFD